MKTGKSCAIIAVAVGALWGGAASAAGTFNIVIVPGAGLSSNAPALAAFNRAALAWSGRIADPITVTINADLSTTQPGGGTFPTSLFGATAPVNLAGGYDVIRNAMVADANAQPPSANNQIIANLPTAAQFTATLPSGRSLNGNINITKANAKAIGFTGLDAPPASGGFGPSDGNITLNSGFAYDYDNTNGVSPGAQDFQSIATREIGHILGFNSSVDTIDTTTSAQAPTIAPTTLDLFRFASSGAGHPTTAAGFTTAPRNLTPGADDVTSDLTSEHRMSTGVQNGDGNSAGSWKADALTTQYIGIMDPTAALGTTEPVTDADFRALDLIGYDVATVPEPVGCAMLAVSSLAMLRRRRIRKENQPEINANERR